MARPLAYKFLPEVQKLFKTYETMMKIMTLVVPARLSCHWSLWRYGDLEHHELPFRRKKLYQNLGTHPAYPFQGGNLLDHIDRLTHSLRACCSTWIPWPPPWWSWFRHVYRCHPMAFQDQYPKTQTPRFILQRITTHESSRCYQFHPKSPLRHCLTWRCDYPRRDSFNPFLN